jgi:hypothetical protein
MQYDEKDEKDELMKRKIKNVNNSKFLIIYKNNKPIKIKLKDEKGYSYLLFEGTPKYCEYYILNFIISIHNHRETIDTFETLDFPFWNPSMFSVKVPKGMKKIIFNYYSHVYFLLKIIIDNNQNKIRITSKDLKQYIFKFLYKID